jgi:ABC-type oligopeptide transport system ATPase subunit
MAVLNLVNPTAGKITFRGNDISDRSLFSKAERLALRKEMQIIFQDPLFLVESPQFPEPDPGCAHEDSRWVYGQRKKRPDCLPA